MSDHQIDCPHCGGTVPDTRFCIRCGESLRGGNRAGSGRRRGSYAAAPAESVARVALFSTILPHLPHADLAAFRLAFAGGLVLLLGLVAVGAFPVALVGAAVLVPALILLYVYSVDVYEGTSTVVLVLTLVWGAAWGAAFGLGIDAITRGAAGLPHRVPLEMLTLGVIVPLLGAAAMMAGPLLLLRDRRYNDVLDGATFGVASAVAFVGAQVVAGSLDLFAGGLTPVGEPLPWVARIASIAVALPIVAAGAIGSAVGAFSLRYRAPIRDRTALGIVGRPAVAVVLAGGLFVAAALATYLPSLIAQVAVQLVLAAVALVWLRQTIHLGLLEEAFEVEVGPQIVCANCGRTTARHTFCGECGIALRALPKRRTATPDAPDASPIRRPPPRPTTRSRTAVSWRTGSSSDHPFPSSGRPHWAPPGDEPARLRGRSVVVGFALLLGVCLVVAVVLAIVAQAPEPPPDCQPGTECGGPPGGGTDASPAPPSGSNTGGPAPGLPPGTIGIRAGTPWISTQLGYQFEYSDWWALDPSNEDPREADFDYQGTSGDGVLIVAAVPTSEADPQAYANRWLDQLASSPPT